MVNVVHDLTERGIGLKVLTGQGAAIDTTTASGKLVRDLRRFGRVRS
jgi:DNA invertase Pin-like site-specific DNA recombinase